MVRGRRRRSCVPAGRVTGPRGSPRVQRDTGVKQPGHRQSARAVLTRMLDGVEPGLNEEIRHAAEHVPSIERVLGSGKTDFKLLRATHHLITRVVNDQVFGSDVGEILRHTAEAIEEQPVGHFQNVRLVDAVNRFAAEFLGQFKREPEEPHTRGLGHDLETLHHAWHDLMFARGVEVFGNLADE